MPAMLMGAPADPTMTVEHCGALSALGPGVDPRHCTRPFEERFGFPLLEAWAMTETGYGAVVIANSTSRGRWARACFGKPDASGRGAGSIGDDGA
jgi:hypothetical protein